jgi:hypothetical protein
MTKKAICGIAEILSDKGHKSLIINVLRVTRRINSPLQKVLNSADKSADTVSKLQNPQLNIIVWQTQINQILLDF